MLPFSDHFGLELRPTSFRFIGAEKNETILVFFRARKTKPFSFNPHKENEKILVLFGKRKPHFIRAKKTKPFSFYWAKKTKLCFRFIRARETKPFSSLEKEIQTTNARMYSVGTSQ